VLKKDFYQRQHRECEHGSTGESSLYVTVIVALLSLESFCCRPKIRNSVLERISERNLEDISKTCYYYIIIIIQAPTTTSELLREQLVA